jgi:hypothetical protein
MGKHVPAVTNTHTTVELFLELVSPCREVIRKIIGATQLSIRVEEGSNAFTVALRVVGIDKKGSLESETVKYGRESHGTALARTSSNCK